MNRLVLAFPLVVVAACGGGDKSPAAPSTTTTGLTVTVSSPVRMGQTTQAAATETLANGQTRPVTTGWVSDAPAVATVSDAGLVTGIANGRATVHVASSGRQGQQSVRVVPDYHGRWNGSLRVTSCAESGIFAEIAFCKENPVGAVFGYALTLSQSAEQVSAVVDYGSSWVFPAIAAPIREDGVTAFTPTLSVTESGVTLTIDAAFNINSTRVGELTGTANEVWRVPNVGGEARLTQEIIGTTRTSTTALSTGSESQGRRLRLFRKIVDHDH